MGLEVVEGIALAFIAVMLTVGILAVTNRKVRDGVLGFVARGQTRTRPTVQLTVASYNAEGIVYHEVNGEVVTLRYRGEMVAPDSEQGHELVKKAKAHLRQDLPAAMKDLRGAMDDLNRTQAEMRERAHPAWTTPKVPGQCPICGAMPDEKCDAGIHC